jgi:hypothetical protein
LGDLLKIKKNHAFWSNWKYWEKKCLIKSPKQSLEDLLFLLRFFLLFFFLLFVGNQFGTSLSTLISNVDDIEQCWIF